MVRSLDEIKEQLRSPTVKVDGQEETVAGLLETGRLFFFYTEYHIFYTEYHILYGISYLNSVQNNRFTDDLFAYTQTFHG